MPLAKLSPEMKRMANHNRTREHMNYFVLASVPLYIGAGITSLVNGNYPMAAVWSCYAAANAFLLFAEFRG